MCYELPFSSGSGSTTVFCEPILVNRGTPGIPPEPCRCPYGFRFTQDRYLQPELQRRLHHQVVTALQNLGKASGPHPQPWRQRALADVTAAAQTIGNHKLTKPAAGYVDPAGRFRPYPEPWRQQLADHLVSGVTIAQQARPGPVPWQELAMNELDAAYTLYARYATPMT